MSEPEDHPDDPAQPDDPPRSPREKAMGFWEHLEELRGTIIKSVLTFVVFACLIGYFIMEFNHVLLWPLHTVAAEYPELGHIQLGTQSIMEVFNMVIQMCVLGGLTLSAPFILFFIGQFVAPALTERELKAVLPMCVAALFLFLVGAAFGFYFLMTSTIRISLQLNQAFDLNILWMAGKYYSTLTWLVLGVGASFEFPLVIILLVWLGLLTTQFLRNYRRHGFVVILVLAALVTPTPDPVTMLIFAAPLYALYEISIIVSSRVEKRQARAQG